MEYAGDTQMSYRDPPATISSACQDCSGPRPYPTAFSREEAPVWGEFLAPLPRREPPKVANAFWTRGSIKRSSVWSGLSLGTALVVASCVQAPSEPAVCLDKRVEGRNAALQGNIEQASRLLKELRAQCGANSQSEIRHIEELIAEKTDARREQERRARSQIERAQKFPSRDFVIWATADAGAIRTKMADAVCVERGAPDFGFCEAARPGAPHMTVRYWTADKDAFRYALTTDQPLSCQDLGEYRQVRAWQRDGSSYELCELTERTLRHLYALLITSSAGNQMYVYSQRYLARDPHLEKVLRVIPPPR